MAGLYVENNATSVLSMAESQKVHADLKKRGESDRILHVLS